MDRTINQLSASRALHEGEAAEEAHPVEEHGASVLLLLLLLVPLLLTTIATATTSTTPAPIPTPASAPTPTPTTTTTATVTVDVVVAAAASVDACTLATNDTNYTVVDLFRPDLSSTAGLQQHKWLLSRRTSREVDQSGTEARTDKHWFA